MHALLVELIEQVSDSHYDEYKGNVIPFDRFLKQAEHVLRENGLLERLEEKLVAADKILFPKIPEKS